MDSEEKYPEIRNKLKNLEQVKAGDDFVNKLHMKIVDAESEKRHEHEARFDEPRGGFLKNLFGNMQYPWLAPAVGFTVLIFFVFYITYLNKTTSDKDQQLLSTQKQENTEQKNTGENKVPAVVQEQDKTLSDKEKQAEKDIAGDLKSEQRENAPIPSENYRGLTDKDEIKTYKEEVKPFESPKKSDAEIETKSIEKESKPPDVSSDKPDTKDKKAGKEKENSINTDESGVLSLKKQDSEANAPGDSGRTARGKVKEDSVKMGRRLKIDQSSLEKIRDEIVK